MNEDQPEIKHDYRSLYAYAYAQFRTDFRTAYRILVDYRDGRISSIHSINRAAHLARENALRSYLLKIGLPPHLAKVL